MQTEEKLLGMSHLREPLGRGTNWFLRLLSAYDLVRCTVNAKGLAMKLFGEQAGDGEELEALAGNGALAAFCVVDEQDQPVFQNAGQALEELTAEELTGIAECYARFRSESVGDFDNLKKN